MPLLDHFKPPLKGKVDWSSFHSNWATRIADQLTEGLPDGFSADEYQKVAGGVEIDIASYRDAGPAGQNGTPSPNLTDMERAGWLPPPASGVLPGVYPDSYEVRVRWLSGGRHLVGAIELVSPGNKDRDETRLAFATKVASYLSSGVSVIVIDVVTERRANLHNETLRLIDAPPGLELPAEPGLYAVSYRPAIRDKKSLIDVWLAPFAVGDPLPTMPLRLTGELFVPVDFEAAYTEACRRRKLIG